MAFNYTVTKTDNSAFLYENVYTHAITLSTISAVASLCFVSPKTVLRAINKDGILIAVASRNPTLTLAQRT